MLVFYQTKLFPYSLIACVLMDMFGTAFLNSQNGIGGKHLKMADMVVAAWTRNEIMRRLLMKLVQYQKRWWIYWLSKNLSARISGTYVSTVSWYKI